MKNVLSSALFGTIIGGITIDQTTVAQTLISGIVSVLLAWIASRKKKIPSDEELEAELKNRERSRWESGT